MQITTLIENEKVKGFFSEKGLSLYIEVEGNKILFDTGKSKKIISNSRIMNINLEEIDYCIISHGHSDHIGGLLELIKNFRIPNILLSENALSNFEFKSFGLKKKIGLSEEQLESLAKIEEIKRITKESPSLIKLDSNIFLIKTFKEESENYFWKNDTKDNFDHELHLIILERSERKNLTIITGCCHVGVEKLIEKIKEEFPKSEIKNLIGGLHTRSYIFNPKKMKNLIEVLKKSQIKNFYLGHCSGRLTSKILKWNLKNVHNLKIGEQIIFNLEIH